ncbi:UDP-N-acetylmuramoyl-L-alanyl-D-glutamate--2,6-diaminopimelate ligase [Aquibacillus halophilus]|uniref:UDP-N-acetylmuramoyl-L-alanyl-D-glutamate--2,6-diaminopimelate ligase n=1 Tax=Aquibacillus halophilus TaxID=930132 RepID=A0A6A8DLN7_9BACI|nr:UDP-N-acetylmuramoyl-L-alanyl-D-glutamate--2,6-diaminopimelate ligase [Aquibacillus halophilus]MRH42162.1 UDP-N-acetylmuramoyl-L-alanyl-D-glutamate--2,6-diaminopimelate ligase [Aquibacillus halophilus]
MKLKDIAEALHFYKATSNLDDIEITGIEMDSRKVKRGNLFVCIAGFTVDGHDYVNDAIERGASAIIGERSIDVVVPVIIVNDSSRALALVSNKYYDYPTNKLKLIGVTGTNGKTTVTHLLKEIFSRHDQKTGLIGTIQMEMDNEVFNVKNTTPDSLFLQKSFDEMINRDIQSVFMEVSSHALDLGRVFGCDFDIAVFTNLTQDHLDYHDTMDDYLRAKSLLFSQLGNSYDGKRPKFAVINLDDQHSPFLIKSTPQPVITYGIDSSADVTASNIKLDASGSEFILNTMDGDVLIRSKLMGKFSIYNMLAATATAICADIPLETIKSALESTTGVNGRFEPVVLGQSFGVIVDYAHTSDSLENVLTTVRSFAKGNIYVVVGCGGDRDRKKRPLMAGVATKYADTAIFTSDNPRSEDPAAIVDDMVMGIGKDNYLITLNRKDAIDLAISMAQKDDIVLIAGKGHETYQIIGEKVIDFDDRKVASEAIRNKFDKEI